MQIGYFKRLTQKAVNNNDIITAKKCFQFVNDHIDIVSTVVENSLAISWLGKLNFDDHNKIYLLLPVKLKDLYTTLHGYDASPQSEKAKSFIDNLDTRDG